MTALKPEALANKYGCGVKGTVDRDIILDKETGTCKSPEIRENEAYKALQVILCGWRRQ